MGRKNTWAHVLEDLPSLGDIGENTISGADLFRFAVEHGVTVPERAFQAALARYAEKGIIKRTQGRDPQYMREEIRDLARKLRKS